MKSPIRIGTRSSHLARWQATWVADRLREVHPGLEITLVEIKTHGDRDRVSPLAAIGGMGLFTKEIQNALLDESVEIAVHSLKDLPTQGPPGLMLGAVPAREDVADALIAPQYKTLESLPAGARIGTGSQRRRAQILHARPDLEVVQLRGNVETRLNHAIDGRMDAVILAFAGLHRLGLDHHVTQKLAPPDFLPAVGQGALGIECRTNDDQTAAFLSALNDPSTHRQVLAERRLLLELEGGCTIPLAAWCREDSGTLVLDGAVFDLDGRQKISASLSGPIDNPEQLGKRVADELRSLGADEVLRGVRATK